MEERYNIKENGFNEIRKKIIFRMILIIPAMVIGGISLTFLNPENQSIDLKFLLMIIPFFIGVIAFSIIRSIKRQKKLFNSYVLTVDDEKMIREQNATPDIEVSIDQIKEITKHKKGGLIIKGSTLNETIWVPAQLESLVELEQRLSKIMEITHEKEKSLLERFTWLFPLLTVGTMFVLAMSENKILVGISAIALTGGLVYSLIVTQKSKHLDNKTRKNMWFVLIVLFFVITVAYYKIFEA